MAVYKRSIFLINKKYQIKFSLLICIIVFISSVIYPVTFVDLIDSFIATNPAAIDELSSTRNELIITLSILQFLIILIIFIVSIFLTHRVAGPMHKLKQTLIKIRGGEALPERFNFRTGDYFHDVAEEVDAFFKYLNENRQNELATIDEINSYIKNLSLVVPEDKRPVLDEIIKKLSQLQTRFESKSNSN